MSRISPQRVGILRLVGLVVGLAVMLPLIRLLETPPYVLGLLAPLVMLVHEPLLAWFGRPEPVARPATVTGAPIGPVSFVRATQLDRTPKKYLHLVLMLVLLVVGQYLQTGEIVDQGRFVLLLCLCIPIILGGILSWRCPTCRHRLLAQRPSAWPRIFSIAACPHCGFVPSYDPELVKETNPIARRAILGLIYVGLIYMALLPVVRGRLPRLEFPVPADSAQTAVNLDWKLFDLDGNEVDAAAFRGKVVFLNIWGSWCLPCRMEMSSIQRLYDEVGKDVAFACVSAEEPDALRRFLTARKLNLPVYTIDEAEAEQIHMPVPTTRIIDAAGRQRFEHVGPADWGDEAAIQFLRALVAESQGAASQTQEVGSRGE